MRSLPRSAVLPAVLVTLTALAGCRSRQAAAIDDPHAQPVVNAPSNTGDHYAMLVACTKYDHLPKACWLEGPANDVVLLRELLVKHFGFPDQNVVTLSEAAGKDRRPTRANIEHEFHSLAEKAKPGDMVVITLSGHGSRQPEKDPPPDPKYAEPDGLDETFLPCDIKDWDSEAGTVTNAIIDDDIRIWTKAITDKGASVWLVADSCHSGDLLRGLEKRREVKPEELKVPKEAIEAAQARAAKRGRSRGNAAPHPRDVDESAQHLVAIYAARTSEETIEKPMPGGKSYGLLSYTICQILNQAKEPLTYRGLVQEINAQYRGLGRSSPTPLVDGPDADAKVLGVERVPSPPVVLMRADGKWVVNAGLVQGLTADSILAVYSDAAGANKPVGYVKVVQAGSLESTVEPCAHGDLKHPGELRDGFSCKPEYINVGDLRLKVAADAGAAPGEKSRDVEREKLQKQLQDLFPDPAHSLVEVVPNPGDAQWLVRARGNEVSLLPAEPLTASRDPNAAPGQVFAPIREDKNLGEELRSRLNRIARAQNLVKLAAPGTPGVNGSDVQVGVRVELLKGPLDKEGRALDWGKDELVFYPDDWIRFRLQNPNDFGIYVTLLYVDSNYGISAQYPTRQQLKPLESGRSVSTDALQIVGDTLGPENWVVIAVKDPGSPVDFRMLAQDSIPGKPRALQSPFGQLLLGELYPADSGEGPKSRGVRRADVGNYTMGLIPSRTLPGKRPAAAH